MTEQIRFNARDANGMSQAVERAVAILKQGGVILYPTDTVYGLGADATNVSAIATINTIKGRGQEKRMIVLASDIDMVERFAMLNPIERKLAEKFWPGPLTIELEHRSWLPDILTGGIRRGGFRIPDHAFCREVVKALGKPITSTSANISGKPQAQTLDGILKDLAEHAHEIDLVVKEQKEQTSLVPSTLVKVEGNTVVIVREGAIARAAIETINIY